MEKTTSERPTVKLAGDDALLGDEDTLSLSQFNVGREIGKGQFSQVANV